MISDATKEAINARMPEVLRAYGIDPTRDFCAPWRDDRKPSCHFSPESGLVTDFGADERFDVFALVGRMEGLDRFPDQARRAAQLLGVEIDETDAHFPTRSNPKAERPRFEQPKKAGFRETPLLMFACLMGRCLATENASGYLHSRGFCSIDIFENVLGFAPRTDTIVDDDGSKLFTLYEPNTPRGYIVIPFFTDETCTTAHYAMLRPIPGEKPPVNKEVRPKGYVSPLYREYLASQGLSVLYVVEGLLDCIAFEKLTGRPTMALGGSATKRLGQLLAFTPPELRPRKIVLALDADDRGRKASAAIAADLDALKIPHATFPYPPGCKDACDLLKMRIGEGVN